jgi:uncharacterized membrane protein YfcA
VVGALAGVLIGTMIVQRVPGHWLRKAFAVFLVVVAVRMLMMPNKPGPSQPDKLNNNPADVLKVKGSSDG